VIIRDRYRPITPNFTKYPLNRIENSVEASTWAFRSQDEKGQRGTFTANPTKRRRSETVEYPSVDDDARTQSDETRAKLPTTLQRYISVRASTALSALAVIRSRQRAAKSMSSKAKTRPRCVEANTKAIPEHAITAMAAATAKDLA